MATNKATIKALERIANGLTALGVCSNDLKILKYHIGQQKNQPAWGYDKKKNWRYGKKE